MPTDHLKKLAAKFLITILFTNTCLVITDVECVSTPNVKLPKGVSYDIASSFYEGLRVVEKNNYYGYVNQQGKVTIPIVYDETYRFSRGLAMVKKDERYGFINKEGKVIIELTLEDADTFFDELIAVKKHGKWGFINTKGEVAIAFNYDAAGFF